MSEDAVNDIRDADAGGEVLGEPMEIPGGGRYVSFFVRR
jgi:predicted enzyme related to lactoylglutathione lyase